MVPQQPAAKNWVVLPVIAVLLSSCSTPGYVSPRSTGIPPPNWIREPFHSVSQRPGFQSTPPPDMLFVEPPRFVDSIPTGPPADGGPAPFDEISQDTSQALEIRQAKGIVRQLVGSARYSIGTNDWNSLAKGTELPAGAVVQTDKGSIADIYLGRENGPSLRMTENTTLAIERLTFAGTGEDGLSETKLDLREGRILGSVRRIGPFSLYEIKTPTGRARTTGGDYDVRSRKNETGKFESHYICINGLMMIAEVIDGIEKTWIPYHAPPRFLH